MKVLPSGRRKPGRLVEIIPDGKFTVCESVGVELREVTKKFAERVQLTQCWIKVW